MQPVVWGLEIRYFYIFVSWLVTEREIQKDQTVHLSLWINVKNIHEKSQAKRPWGKGRKWNYVKASFSLTFANQAGGPRSSEWAQSCVRVCFDLWCGFWIWTWFTSLYYRQGLNIAQCGDTQRARQSVLRWQRDGREAVNGSKTFCISFIPVWKETLFLLFGEKR